VVVELTVFCLTVFRIFCQIRKTLHDTRFYVQNLVANYLKIYKNYKGIINKV